MKTEHRLLNEYIREYFNGKFTEEIIEDDYYRYMVRKSIGFQIYLVRVRVKELFNQVVDAIK